MTFPDGGHEMTVDGERTPRSVRGTMRVHEVMTAPVVTASPGATLEELAALMLDAKVGSVVIVDGEVPVGIVTETDFEVADEPIPFTVFRWPRVLGKYVWSERSLEGVYALARQCTAETVMSRPLVTVGADALLWEAVELMVNNHVNRLPVVDEGRLVGIVSRHDLLKCFLAEATAPT